MIQEYFPIRLRHWEVERATSAEFKQVSRFMTESELSGTSKCYQSLFPFLEGRVLVMARQSKRCKSEKFCLIIVSLSLLSCRFLRRMKKRINYVVIPGGITKAPNGLLTGGSVHLTVTKSHCDVWTINVYIYINDNEISLKWFTFSKSL